MLTARQSLVARHARFDEASGRVPGSRRTHRRRASRPVFDASMQVIEFEAAKRVDFRIDNGALQGDEGPDVPRTRVRLRAAGAGRREATN